MPGPTLPLRASWLTAKNGSSPYVQAELLLLSRRDDPSARDALEQLVSKCAREGWVLPFLGLPDAITDRVRSLPLEKIHPQLAWRLTPSTRATITQDALVQHIPLTSREASLIPLLPTHMSYSEMESSYSFQ